MDALMMSLQEILKLSDEHLTAFTYYLTLISKPSSISVAMSNTCLTFMSKTNIAIHRGSLEKIVDVNGIIKCSYTLYARKNTHAAFHTGF